MSAASASVTTSAGSPSSTARADAPEPLCDWLMTTVSPVLRFQAAMNARLKSRYSSRVGSYETFSSVVGSRPGGAGEQRAGGGGDGAAAGSGRGLAW